MYDDLKPFATEHRFAEGFLVKRSTGMKTGWQSRSQSAGDFVYDGFCQLRGLSGIGVSIVFGLNQDLNPRNKKGPPCGEPFSVLRMVPAPRVELGTY